MSHKTLPYYRSDSRSEKSTRTPHVHLVQNSSCKLHKFAIFCKYICASTNPILLKIDMHVRFTMMHV